MYSGDIALGSTLDIKFTTRQFSSGAPFTLAGSPAVAAYVDNSTTEITAGLTLTVDFDSRTGLNNIRVVASGGNGFAAGTNVDLVITAGTVDGVSVVGEVVGSFSIENRSALRPTTAGRTLDVSAGGEAGVDWANVGSSTTTLDLSGTTIAVTQKVDVNTIKTNPVVNGGTVTFPTNATLASTTNITAGTVTTATNVTTVNGLAANVITATAIAANAFAAAKFATDYYTTVQALILSDATPFPGAAIDAAISTRATPAQVGTQVAAALATTTYAEPTGVPPATTTLEQKIGRIYQALRNGLTVDATDMRFHNDAGVDLWRKPLADDGTTYTEGEGVAP